jgi:3-deoxy-D-manno-octulosonic acid kinase
MRKNNSQTNLEHIHLPKGHFELMFDDERWPTITKQQFSASGYLSAQPVSGKGGRGSAWFVETPIGPAVLKHYRRGGWAAKFTASHYLYLGLFNTRSLKEFQLLSTMRDADLPVPIPLAAFCVKRFGFYQAALLTVRIENTHSLTDALRNQSAPWTKVGKTLARFHAMNIKHADLNANNVLISESGEVFFIDWDKGEIGTSNGSWFEKVLARLIRSLRKEKTKVDTGYLESGIKEMIKAYKEAMP